MEVRCEIVQKNGGETTGIPHPSCGVFSQKQGRKEGRKEGRKGGREGGREEGKEEGRKGGRKGMQIDCRDSMLDREETVQIA